MPPTSKYFLLVFILMVKASASRRLIASELENSGLGEVSADPHSRILQRRRKPKKNKPSNKKSSKKTSRTRSTKKTSKSTSPRTSNIPTRSTLTSSSTESASVCRSGKYYGDYCQDEKSDCNKENSKHHTFCTTGGLCDTTGLCLAGEDISRCGYISGIGEIVLSSSVAWDWSEYDATNNPCAEILTGEQDLSPNPGWPGTPNQAGDNTLVCNEGTGNFISDYTFTSQFNITKRDDVYSSDVTGGSVCEIYDEVTGDYSYFNRHVINFLLNDSGVCYEGTSKRIICTDSNLCDYDSDSAKQTGPELLLQPVACPNPQP